MLSMSLAEYEPTGLIPRSGLAAALCPSAVLAKPAAQRSPLEEQWAQLALRQLYDPSENPQVKLTGGCKNVAIAVSADGNKLYFCDQPGSKFHIFEKK